MNDSEKEILLIQAYKILTKLLFDISDPLVSGQPCKDKTALNLTVDSLEVLVQS